MNDTWWLDPEELNEEQAPIIELPIGKSYLITGPPGSGKTNLVLLRANFLYLSKYQNIEVVVFTRTLQEFIANGGGQYDFPVEKVKTGIKFFEGLLRQYGVRMTLPEPFPELRQYLIDQTLKLVAEKNLTDVFEAILLDEGHSFVPSEILLFSRLAKTMFIAADARQQIYDCEDCTQELKDAVDKEYPLELHHRIGRKICKVADALMAGSPGYRPMLESSQYNEAKYPSRVDPPIRRDSIASQVTSIIESLKKEMNTYPGEFLGVLCPTRRVLNEARQIINSSELADVCICQGDAEVVTFTPEKKVVVCTIHAAQGVEFRVVHIAGAESVERLPKNRNTVFTAVTRAKTRLYVYHTGTLPGYFEQAIQTAQPPGEIAKVADAFGRKRKL
jgi:superfamily I DNA/RNA helicase